MQAEAPRRTHWFNLPNCLSVMRAMLTLPMVWALTEERFGLCSVIFTAAVVSDLLDGPLARRRGESTRLGMILDHSADALFVVAANTVFAIRGDLPFALPVLIAAAFTQYALDSRIFRGAPFRTSQLGRWNGIAYFVVIGVALGAAVLKSIDTLDQLLQLMAWLLVGSSALSMLERAWKLWIRTGRSGD